MRSNSTVPFLNLLVGVFFLLSAFLWQRTGGERVNAIVVGVLALAVGWGALRVPALRWADVVLGAWMLLSIWLVPHADRFSVWSLVSFGAAMAAAPFIARWLPEARLERVEA